MESPSPLTLSAGEPMVGRRPRLLVHDALVGLRLAVIGSAALGALECLGVTILTAKHFPVGAWPVDLIAAALGKATLTHTLLWCPLLALGAVAYRLITAGKAAHGSAPFLSALFVVLVAVIVVPADLDLAYKSSLSLVVAVSVAMIACGVGVYFGWRAALGRLGRRRTMRALNVVAILSALLTVLSSVVFVRSPLFNPAGYRVPAASKVAGDPAHPHVLWIVLDTVRADRVSYHGHDKTTTPFLESWASRSIVFDRAIANGAWTPPSHASMFTGLSVRRHGVENGHLWLDDDFTTIAEVLSSRGYETALFSANPYLCSTTNLAQGFEVTWVTYYLRKLSMFSLEHLAEKWGIVPPVSWLDREFGGAITNHLAGQWLDVHAERDAPLLMFVNLMEAHLPYLAPKSYLRMFMTDEQVKRSYELRRRAYGSIVDAVNDRFNLEGGGFLQESDREVLRRRYDAAIRYVDERARELVRMFDERGLLENTLVVITSDHGEHLGINGLWGHRFLAYNALTHVPLLVREPGGSKPIRVSTPVQLSDLYRTVLQVALGDTNHPIPDESRDLLAVAASGGESRIAISERTAPAIVTREEIRKLDDPRAAHLAAAQITAQDGRFKYMVSADGLKELYDLYVDPQELTNVIHSYPDEAERLTAHIREWLETTPFYQPEHSHETREMDPDLIEALRSLGYVGD